MLPGYYDVSFEQWSQEYGEDGPLGPPKSTLVTWLGALVLLIDANGDAIVEHYPEGWAPGVCLRRIDRIPAEHVGTTYRFAPVALPGFVA